jgi:hypothetical protein
VPIVLVVPASRIAEKSLAGYEAIHLGNVVVSNEAAVALNISKISLDPNMSEADTLYVDPGLNSTVLAPAFRAYV